MQKVSYNTITYFKKLLIIFWGVWWLSALWTDVVGGLAYLGVLQAEWAPAKNYPFLVESLKMYPLYSWIPTVLFMGIIVWMSLIVGYFLVTILAIATKKPFWRLANQSFAISMGLWLAFLLADQMIMNYQLEANHMVQACFQLLCWIFVLNRFK